MSSLLFPKINSRTAGLNPAVFIVVLFIVNQRERERRNSDRSEDGYHSDGDYGEHDYRHDISDERESKTIMLRGLPITITESDVRGQQLLEHSGHAALPPWSCVTALAQANNSVNEISLSVGRLLSVWCIRSYKSPLPFRL